MKARLVPLYFQSADDPDFVNQMTALRGLLSEQAELLEPLPLGAPLPEADAVVFPQMLGDAYKRLEEIKALNLPILVITSEFGTVSMWDWEINNYLASEGVRVLAPYNIDQARKLCDLLVLKRELRQSKLLVYQDNPGEGFQASIFKRFYWWEPEAIQRLEDVFGLKVVKKSYAELAAKAKAISDDEARAEWRRICERIPVENLSERAVFSAIKLYLAVKRDLALEPGVVSVGINCLNESHFSDTTPCLAWNILYEEEKMVWGCEADLVSMLTEVLMDKGLSVPFMMTNLYPFLMGMAALKHERIPNFPAVESEPENHVLTAHCGFLGVVPQSFSTEWKMREKVLAIVDENAHALDARLPEGDVTLVKLMPPFDQVSVIEGQLTGYAQFPGSDCRNGAVIRVSDGRKMLNELASHHYILTSGKNLADVQLLAQVFGLQVKVLD